MYRGNILHIFSVFMTGMILLLNTGCSGGGGSDATSSSNPPSSLTISGVVQKGYFVDGAIIAYSVESNGSLSQKSVTSSIDAKGNYKLSIPWSGLSFLSAEGHFFNEYTGETTTDTIELNALVDANQTQNANLNLFTSLEANRVLVLMQEGKTYTAALQETKDAMERVFGLTKDVNATLLDMFDTNSTYAEENLNLLLLSATFLKVVEDEDEITRAMRLRAAQGKYGFGAQRFYEDFKKDGGVDGLFKDDWEKIINDDENKTLEVVSKKVGKDFKFSDKGSKWATRLRLSVSNPSYIFESTRLKEIRYDIGIVNSSLLSLGTRYVVSYTTQDATAVAGNDYNETNGTMVFSRVTNNYTIIIPVLAQSDVDKDLNIHFSADSANLVIPNADLNVTIPKRDLTSQASNLTISQLALERVSVDGYRSNVGVDDKVILIGSSSSDVTLRFYYRGASLLPASYFVNIYAIKEGSEPLLVKENVFIPTVGRTGAINWQIGSIPVTLNDSLRTLFESANTQEKKVYFKVVAMIDANTTVEKTSAAMPTFAQVGSLMNPHTLISGATFNAPLDANCQPLATDANFSASRVYASMDIDGLYQANGMQNSVSVHYDDVCIQLDKNISSHAFDATLVDGYGVLGDTLDATLGGNDIVIDVDKITSSHIEVNSIKVTLPKEHSVHAKEGDGSLNPRGLPYLEVRSNINLNADANLSALEISGSMDSSYLHTTYLPFAFLLGSYNFNANGFVFSSAQPYYLFSGFNRHINNAELFSRPKQGGVPITLTKYGLSSDTITFLETDSNLSFPRVESKVGTFEVKVHNSILEQVDANISHTVIVDYLQNCYNSECSATAQRKQLEINATNTQLFSDGSFIATKTGAIGEAIEWGSKDNSTVFKRLDESDARIYLGGFVLPTNTESSIGSFLLGGVKQNGDFITYYSTQTVAARDGKNLFAGVNFGNFENPNLSSMKDKTMSISLGEGVALTLKDSEYSKYYIRPSGVTGVFNPQDESNDIRVYGYDMRFESFKFAQRENTLEPFTKINGKVHVVGKGDFDVLFNNLQLACSGNLGGGKISDKQGHVILDAWKTDSILTTIDFRNKDNEVCSNTKSLELGHILKIAAYKKELGLNTFWSNIGIPFDSRIISATSNQLDGNSSLDNTEDNGGYNVALRDIAFRSDVNGLATRDWIETNASFGLPFWGINEMSVRLQNKTTTQRAPTVVTAKGELYQDGRAQNETNEELVAKIVSDYKHNVEQDWAKVMHFGLPVYYNATTDTSVTPPFLGRKLSSDLIVLQADAGVNFITPYTTRMSFGASADFEKIKGLDLHIDLNDPQSLKNVDASLKKYLGIENALEDTVGVLVENINIGNKLLKEGMTLSMEKTALLALKAAGGGANDPFEKVTKINAQLHALPATMKDRITEMFTQKLNMVFDTSYNLTIEQKTDIIDEFLDDYEAFVAYLDDINAILNALPSVSSDDMKNFIFEYGFGSASANCSYTNFTQKGFFQPIDKGNQAIAKVNDKLQKISISKIRNISQKVSDYTGFDADDLVATAQKVKDLSKDLDGLVNDLNSSLIDAFNDEFCNGLESGIAGMEIVGAKIDAAMEMKTELTNEVAAILARLHSQEVALILEQLRDFAQQENLVDLDLNITNIIVAPISASLDTLAYNIQQDIPNIDADDMRRVVVSQIFRLDVVQNFNIDVALKLTPVADELNKLSLTVFSGFDRSIKNMIARLNDKVNELLSGVTSKLDAIPLAAASMDGYALFYGDSLVKVHVGSEFSVTGKDKESSFGFNAALDIENDAINDKVGCTTTTPENGNLRATISTRDISMPLGEKEMKVDLLLLGVTIGSDGEVKGIFGAITSESEFGYDTFALYDLGLATGIGVEETYLGAKASARMDSLQLGVSFLVGQVCNRLIVESIIPEAVNDFITIPNNRFNGALVFGEGQMPIYTNGCTLTVIARAKLGTWFLFGPPKTFGGIVGGGAFGKALCIATLGGEVEVLAEKSGDVVRFKGSGWGAAGVGSCDSSWSSVSDSRHDSWCGTGDARFGALYDDGWSLEKIRTSAVH